MRRHQDLSPLPPDAPGRQDVMSNPRRPAPGTSPAPRDTATNAPAAATNAPAAATNAPAAATNAPAAAASATGSPRVSGGPDRPVADALRRGAVVQLAAAVAALTGLWVAISPWFLTLQTPTAGNARTNDLIVGLAAAVIGMLAISRLTGIPGLAGAGVGAGIWLIISPFILDAKYAITASMYWSNIWAGAIVVVAGLAMLGASQVRTAR